MPQDDSSVITQFTTPIGSPQNNTATPGETITVSDQWTVSLDQNTQTGDIVLQDTLNGVIPASDVTVNNGGSYNAGIITWDLGTFSGVGTKNGNVSFGDYTAQITVPSDYAQNEITSLATITPAPGDIDTSNNTSMASINIVCFSSGTLIQTVAGCLPVESLRVGDLVVTHSGSPRPVRWLGHRVTRCAGHRKPELVNPIRIAAHAFGPNRPARDLVVSPGHALCFDVAGEVLIPASALVNGTTVVQLDVEQITYWHVELDSHDIILAENMPAESYLEMGNRTFFAEAEAVALHGRPDAPIATHADFCRLYVDRGPQLEAVRAMLREIQASAETPRKVAAVA